MKWTSRPYLKDITPAVKRRIDLEERIARATVRALLAAGFSVSVFNGEEDLLVKDNHGSTNVTEVIDQMSTTDEDYLNAWKDGKIFGWVYFIYGEDGWDVINNHTVNLEPYIGEGTEVDKLIEANS